MNSELTPCPRCNAKGVMVGMFLRYADGVPQSERKPAIELECQHCCGTGQVTAEQLEKMAAGEARRQARIHRGVGLREEAENLGLLPSELAKLEAGLD